ncbi:hypothetical protein QTO34_013739 [Cnephaeus nilssonii]|uniref:Uridine diphosphate glucose pyrophosphatase NUDT14 n=1 Tax=Cnephaeus nilssonii TaxID=3371016 RepID=A0AA40I9R9_CNENI|nr:hypothetical protein QTO34_013739 [Eptesicus nilssonii]
MVKGQTSSICPVVQLLEAFYGLLPTLILVQVLPPVCCAYCYMLSVRITSKMEYEINGRNLCWAILKTTILVALVIYNSSLVAAFDFIRFRESLGHFTLAQVVVRGLPLSLLALQGLPRVRRGAARLAGVMYELCAGIMDQPGLSLEEVACKEAWEECGYLLSPGELLRVATYKAGVGLTGSSQTMFYAEVTDAQKGGPGRGLAEEGELIEVVHLPLGGAQAFSDNPSIPKTLSVIFAISWFLHCVGPGLGLQ